MQSPSQGVHRDLIPHVHCLSTFRYPVKQQVHPQQVAQWLKDAPEIANLRAPFCWSYLDRPADGTIVMAWQPLDVLGTASASDGYIWQPQEATVQMEVEGGYVLEIYQFKSGYAPGEQYTAHARARYRLLPPRMPNGGPPVDPNLWIIHWSAAEPQDRVPIQMMPTDTGRVQHTMNTRGYLQQQGQIMRKEFMLRDAAHWPQIQWPQGGQGQGQMRGPQYSGPARTPQSMAYATGPPSASAPPAKRARTGANPNSQANMAAPVHMDMPEDDEETSRGDVFDHMTPREISLARYKQNHRWMEEILSSPYATNQITPVDLGLGLKGALGTVTDGIFAAPSGNEDDPHQYDYIGRLDAGKAEEFRKRVSERMEADNKEMERMKAKHAKRMAKFKRGALLVASEKSLRTAVHDPADVGPEYWRLEGKIDDDEDEGDSKGLPKAAGKVDDIVAQVEASLGRHAAAVESLRRLQDGGLEELAVQSPAVLAAESRNNSNQSGVLVGDGDLEMDDSAAGLLDQFHTGFSATSTPGNSFPTPQALSLGTPHNISSPQPQTNRPDLNTSQNDSPATVNQSHGDAMQGMESGGPPAETNKGGEAGDDWVVVPKGGVSPPPTTAIPAQAPAAKSEQTAGPADMPNQTEIQHAVQQAAEPQSTPSGNPDVSNTHDLDLNNTDSFDADPADFGHLEDLDTAGEALAGFDAGDETMGGRGSLDLGEDMDLGMDVDDSAFGDAFAGVEHGHGDGDNGMSGHGEHGGESM